MQSRRFPFLTLLTLLTRRRPVLRSFAAAAALLLLTMTGAAQSPYNGFTLFCPNNGRATSLLAMDGSTAHSWQHSLPGGYSTYLLEDGSLLRPASLPNAQLRGAASSGLIERIGWDGAVLWSYTYSGSTWIAHHDIEPMPNGNVLLIAWEVKSASEASALGRQNAQVMWPDHIVEVKPTGSNTGDIVWEWHAWDHLVQDRDPSKPDYGVIADNPGRLDINLISNSQMPGGGDWLHINGISYNPVDDLIVISSHFMNEFYVIDHSTTTEEARGSSGGRHGRGGDILYRWGNPSNYGASGTKVFDVVHCAYWVPEGLPGAGNILAFNNAARARASVVVEVIPPRNPDGSFASTAGQAFGPVSPVWSYSAGTSFFSNHLGGNQRLPNGNTFLTEATEGDLREVTPDGTVVWEYNHSREIARALRYGREYAGVSRLVSTGTGVVPETPVLKAWNAPNPFSAMTTIHYEIPSATALTLTVHDALGREVRRFEAASSATGTGQFVWDGRDAAGNTVPTGLYLLRAQTAEGMFTSKLVKM